MKKTKDKLSVLLNYKSKAAAITRHGINIIDKVTINPRLLLLYQKFNLPTLCVLVNLFYDECSDHVEPSQLICSANQLTGFYMMGVLVVKRLTWCISQNILNKKMYVCKYCNMRCFPDLCPPLPIVLYFIFFGRLCRV